MKTTTLKWVIGIVAIMFVFASNGWARGKHDGGRGDHGSKYQQRDYKDKAHHYKHRGHDRQRRGDRYRQARRHHQPRHNRHYDRRPHHRHYAKAYRGHIRPNPLFWLFPFPPLTPFVYE